MACDTAVCMCIVEFGKEVSELADVDGAMDIDDGDLDLVVGNDRCVVNVESTLWIVLQIFKMRLVDLVEK